MDDQASAIAKLERSRFTTRLRGRMIDILPTFFKQLKLDWNQAELSQQLGEQIIDVDAKGLTIDQLLNAISESAKCGIKRDGMKITISPFDTTTDQ